MKPRGEGTDCEDLKLGIGHAGFKVFSVSSERSVGVTVLDGGAFCSETSLWWAFIIRVPLPVLILP